MDDPRNCENQLFYCLRPASMVAALGYVRISGTQCTVAWDRHYRYYKYSAIIQSLLVQRIRRWPCENSVQQFPGLLGPKWGCSGIINLRMALWLFWDYSIQWPLLGRPSEGVDYS